MTLDASGRWPYARCVSTPAPIEVIECGQKQRNGLFLRRIALYSDRVAFEIFTSRAFDAGEFENLRPSDGTDTVFTMSPLSPEIEGRGEIAFTPAPADLSSLHLSGSGWGLQTFIVED